HGAAWVAYKTEGALGERAVRAVKRIWWLVLLLTVAITLVSFSLLPRLWAGFHERPLGFVFPLLAIAGLAGILWFASRKQAGAAFAASCSYLLGMLTSVVFSLYPAVLPSSFGDDGGLTIANAKAADYGLKIGLVWWILGMALASGYTIAS